MKAWYINVTTRKYNGHGFSETTNIVDNKVWQKIKPAIKRVREIIYKKSDNYNIVDKLYLDRKKRFHSEIEAIIHNNKDGVTKIYTIRPIQLE